MRFRDVKKVSCSRVRPVRPASLAMTSPGSSEKEKSGSTPPVTPRGGDVCAVKVTWKPRSSPDYTISSGGSQSDVMQAFGLLKAACARTHTSPVRIRGINACHGAPTRRVCLKVRGH